MNTDSSAVKKAILVGITYPPGSELTPLKYTPRDAEEMNARLKRLGFHTVLIPSEQATRERLETELRRCQREQGELLVFYFSGHGQLIDGALNLHPVNSNADGDRCVPFSFVYNLWKRSFGYRKVLVILDACRHGFVPKGGKGAPACTDDMLKDVRQAASDNAICVEVIYGCDEGQVSWEAEELKHSLLTAFLLQVLDEGRPYVDLNYLVGAANDRMLKWCKDNPKPGRSQKAYRYGTPTHEDRIVLVDREEEAWSQATARNTIEAYEEFLRDFSFGVHAPKARKALAELQESESWRVNEAEDTAEAYQRHYQRWPQGAHTAEADRRAHLRVACAAHSSQHRRSFT